MCFVDNQKQENVALNNKTSNVWNVLGAKPKNNSSQRKKREPALSGDSCNATGWPALPTRPKSSSTPVFRRTRTWTAVSGKPKMKLPPPQTTIPLQNRFAPIQKSSSPLDHQDEVSSHSKVNRESKLENKRQRGKLMPGPETLIVGDAAVKDLRHLRGKRTKILYFPKDMVSDVRDNIVEILAEPPTVKTLVLHLGSTDTVKPQSGVLKQDFKKLLDRVNNLDADVFISGPLPPMRGDERFSRLFSLNKWLSGMSATYTFSYIDNFVFFWDRRHYYKADVLCLNISGVRLLAAKIFYVLSSHSAPATKDRTKRKHENKDKDVTQPRDYPQTAAPQPPSASPDDVLLELSEIPPPLKGRNEDLPSSRSSSPSLPLLDFTEHMMELVTFATRMTPCPIPLPFRRPAPPPPPPQTPYVNSISSVHRRSPERMI